MWVPYIPRVSKPTLRGAILSLYSEATPNLLLRPSSHLQLFQLQRSRQTYKQTQLAKLTRPSSSSQWKTLSSPNKKSDCIRAGYSGNTRNYCLQLLARYLSAQRRRALPRQLRIQRRRRTSSAVPIVLAVLVVPASSAVSVVGLSRSRSLFQLRKSMVGPTLGLGLKRPRRCRCTYGCVELVSK